MKQKLLLTTTIIALLGGLPSTQLQAAAPTTNTMSKLIYEDSLPNKQSHIVNAKAITKVYGDGEQLDRILLTYDTPLRSDSLQVEDFTVPNRTITAVSLIDSPDVTNSKNVATSPYVLLQLSPLPMISQGATMSKPTVDPHPEEHTTGQNPLQGGPKLGSSGNPQPLPTFDTTLAQVGIVKTASDKLILPENNITTTSTDELVIKDFQQGIFIDSAQNNATLQYNLYIPKDYDPTKKYPLVVFLHDAGTVSPEVKATLVQGLGAIAFASPEWQANHPSFVLAPQYDTVIVNDQYQYGPELDRTIHLINELAEQYAIDKDRIYNTGQSMGAMASTQLDINYPDFFAGSYLIAGKWDDTITAPLGNQNIMALVSAGDPGAKPSFDKIMNNLEASHHTVVRATVNPETDLAKASETIGAAFTPYSHLYYFTFEGGNHRSTWQYGYSIKPALEWLFQQKRPASQRR